MLENDYMEMICFFSTYMLLNWTIHYNNVNIKEAYLVYEMFILCINSIIVNNIKILKLYIEFT